MAYTQQEQVTRTPDTSDAKEAPAENARADDPSPDTYVSDYLRIEQAAARTGLTKRTLRYYEEIGLLDPPTRTEGNYRLYSPRDITRIELIKRMRNLLGFTLAEIKEIALLEEGRAHYRAAWEHATSPAERLELLTRSDGLTQQHLALVSEKIADLEALRAELEERLERHERLRHDLEAQVQAGEGSHA